MCKGVGIPANVIRITWLHWEAQNGQPQGGKRLLLDRVMVALQGRGASRPRFRHK